MMLFPLTRPQACLHMTAKKICFAQIKVGWKTAKLCHYIEHPLPSGMVRLSPMSANIHDAEELRKILGSFLTSHTSGQSISLSLPDLCARTAIFELSAIPKNVEECQALISWRFKTDLNISTANTRLIYRVFRATGSNRSSSSTQPTRVLASTIQTDILDSFEKMCLQVGLIPMTVNLASLTVFDWCRDAMAHCAQNQSTAGSKKAFFCYLADWGFSLFVIQDDVPVFLRIKPLLLTLPHSSVVAYPSRTKTMQNVKHSDEPSSPACTHDNTTEKEDHTLRAYTKTVANELIATLQFFFETSATADSSQDQAQPLTLYLVGSAIPQTILPHLASLIEHTFPQFGSDLPHITAMPLYSNRHNSVGRNIAGIDTYTDSLFPTVTSSLVSS